MKDSSRPGVVSGADQNQFQTYVHCYGKNAFDTKIRKIDDSPEPLKYRQTPERRVAIVALLWERKAARAYMSTILRLPWKLYSSADEWQMH